LSRRTAIPEGDDGDGDGEGDDDDDDDDEFVVEEDKNDEDGADSPCGHDCACTCLTDLCQ
jgi:hypothetical protein